MTEELQARLRHGARNIHSIGPVSAATLLDEAAAWIEATTAAARASWELGHAEVAGAIRESTTAQQQFARTRVGQLAATEAVRAAKTDIRCWRCGHSNPVGAVCPC